MQITPEHVGTIIHTNCPPSFIQIEAVSESLVECIHENGTRYATFSHEIEGSVIGDPDRIREFQVNSQLGLALISAEQRAITSLLDGTATKEQRTDAISVLESVKRMQNRLMSRTNLQSKRDAGNLNQHRSLDSIISQASAESKAKQKTDERTVPFEMDR